VSTGATRGGHEHVGFVSDGRSRTRRATRHGETERRRPRREDSSANWRPRGSSRGGSKGSSTSGRRIVLPQTSSQVQAADGRGSSRRAQDGRVILKDCKRASRVTGQAATASCSPSYSATESSSTATKKVRLMREDDILPVDHRLTASRFPSAKQKTQAVDRESLSVRVLGDGSRRMRT